MSKLKEYKIKIEICTEAIFTSGEKERNLVQSKAQTDSHGFVYYHAKTLKGQLKRQAFWILKQYKSIDEQNHTKLADEFFNSIILLFGTSLAEVNKLKKTGSISSDFKYCGQCSGLMRLSNLELDKNLRDYFIELQKVDEAKEYYQISPHDLIEAQTHIRTGIQIEDGVAADKMFNTYHTVREGLVFYATAAFEAEAVSHTLVNDLARIVNSFRRIGAGIHRGRGEIKAQLLADNTPINPTI